MFVESNLRIFIVSKGDDTDDDEYADEDGTLFTRVDDMIFLSKRVKAGLSSYRFHWPDGIIPFKIQQGFRKSRTDKLFME